MPEVRVDPRLLGIGGVIHQAVAPFLKHGPQGNNCVVFDVEKFNTDLWIQEVATTPVPIPYVDYVPQTFVVAKIKDGALAIYKVPAELRDNPLSAVAVDRSPIYKGTTVGSILSFLMEAVEPPQRDHYQEHMALMVNAFDGVPLKYRVSLCSLESRETLLNVSREDYPDWNGLDIKPKLEEYIKIVNDQQL